MSPRPKFILSCGGSIVTPAIYVGVYEETVERADAAAQSMVATLSRAGYFNFWLTQSGDTDVEIARYMVEQQSPLVTRIR